MYYDIFLYHTLSPVFITKYRFFYKNLYLYRENTGNKRKRLIIKINLFNSNNYSLLDEIKKLSKNWNARFSRKTLEELSNY